VHALGVLDESGARGVRVRCEIVAFVVERCRAGLDRDDRRTGVRVPAAVPPGSILRYVM
jgi:hypothetical protein